MKYLIELQILVFNFVSLLAINFYFVYGLNIVYS